MSHSQPRDAQGHFRPTGQPPKKKGGCLKIGAIIAGVIVLLIILAGACTAMFAGEDTGTPPATEQPAEQTTGQTATPEVVPPPAEEEPAADTVRMVVTSDSPGTSNVSWGDMLGGSHQSEDFTGTWEKEVPAGDDASYSVTVTPDWMSQGTFTVTCELYVNGELADEATATGTPGGTMATCSQPLF